MRYRFNFTIFETLEPRRVLTYHGKYNLHVEIEDTRTGEILWRSDTTWLYPCSREECEEIMSNFNKLDYEDDVSPEILNDCEVPDRYTMRTAKEEYDDNVCYLIPFRYVKRGEL